MGYSYLYDDFQSDDLTARSHAVFIYGEYKPSDFYVNLTADYEKTRYRESKDNSYSWENMAVQAAAGYTFGFITPQVAVRSLWITHDDYTTKKDERVADKTYSVVSALAGVKIAHEFALTQAYRFVPQMKVSMIYDMKSADRWVYVQAPSAKGFVKTDGLSSLGTQVDVRMDLMNGQAAGIGLQRLYGTRGQSLPAQENRRRGRRGLRRALSRFGRGEVRHRSEPARRRRLPRLLRMRREPL